MTLTFLTPVGPNHIQYLPACIASVNAQSIPCKHLIAHDTNGLGPAVLRNQMLAQASTEYVTFLDADDWVEPDFAERMLAAARRAPYVYSDWYQDGVVKQAPERAWCAGTFHLVTAVVPRAMAIQVGGFDETLEALEDTDFWLKFISRGWCGARVPHPLVHYRAHGGRSDAIHASPERLEHLRSEINQRYRDNQMGCCGDPSPLDNTPIGEQRDGDVLAMALWGGNRTEHGRATGRRYPRTSYPHTTWVDPRDVRAAPHLWKIVEAEPAPVAMPVITIERPVPKGVDALRNSLAGWGTAEEVIPTPLATPIAAVPNVNKIKRLAGILDLPTFVMPRNIYPSYADFWKLVDLSGFETVHPDETDLADGDRTYIFSGPEGIPDCSGVKARTIFWQLEYVGDYTDQVNHRTVGEVWSSDPEHARLTDARFVLMGSNKALMPDDEQLPVDPSYDFTMLAYMTPRRQAIKDTLGAYTWPPDYPGHDTLMRHRILLGTCLMLNINQFDAPALAPSRLALAAAYFLPVLAEKVIDGKPYGKAVIWSAYSRLAKKAEALLQDADARDEAAQALHTLLCKEHPFFDCVMEALDGK